jgi:hypothetical protein
MKDGFGLSKRDQRVAAALERREAKANSGSQDHPSRVAYERTPHVMTTTAAPFTNSSISPTLSRPIGPGPNTSQDSSTAAASTPMAAATMKAATMRLGDRAGLGSWSRYRTTAVTGTRKLPSNTTLEKRMTSPVKYAVPTVAIQSNSPISRTATSGAPRAAP